MVVDDASTDGTGRVLDRLCRELPRRGKLSFRFLRHQRNLGKGAAIRTAIPHADGDVCIVHDADLEYHPRDIPRMLVPFLEEEADVVYGSRFSASGYRRVLFFHHELGNRLLTFLCNLVSNCNLTDMETCYKAVRTPLLKSIPLVSKDFRFEPEITIKLAKRRARLYEVPISYSGRTIQEGKKIRWIDGILALVAIVRFALDRHIDKAAR